MSWPTNPQSRRDVPFFDGVAGRVYFRTWRARAPHSNVLLLHGFGEHTGHYHRLAHELTAAAFDVWGLDHIGHGHTEGDRGLFDSVDDLARNALMLLDRIAHEASARPTVVVGHSLGALTGALMLLERPDAACGLIMTGAPLHGLPHASDSDEPIMSLDEAYLDALDNDPLGFDTSPCEPNLWRALGIAGDKVRTRLPAVDLATLLINGDHDAFAAPSDAEAFARSLHRGRAVVIPGGHHDIPNDVAHREVAALIAEAALEWCRPQSHNV
ncbi:alpha/beta fold hydrolase [Mycolicibacterium sp. BiH015]|uniref:alpha/beta fold hydrolase n=1 Tax=Mycolicibacterium sp. BiH015 TaxID=3018808 RepID=UPI0022E14490|nr:alpha/beta fold hydrolase [Mycolicibacterium sp. BiH015]MDA2893286.1 alpha/beta fold hydrolase [Mycolicibacterium sp. BiH015]